jgi:hypothetical protein
MESCFAQCENLLVKQPSRAAAIATTHSCELRPCKYGMQCKHDLLFCVMLGPCRLQLEVLLHAISLAFCCLQVSLPCLQQQQ